MPITSDGIKTQKFGVEIEMTGLTRARAAKVVASYFGTTAEHLGGSYDKYNVRDGTGRNWTIVSDASIRCTRKDGTSAGKIYSVEFVTPVCTYDDMETIQQLVRDLRSAGGVCNDSTGIHIHINAEPFNAHTLRNLVNIVASKEEMIYHALQVKYGRQGYCKKVDRDFLERINRKKPETMQQLKDLWYDGRDGSRIHYHNSRYHLLNLHSVFSKGTVEIRAFNSTLHAGVLRSYIVFCLAMSNQAMQQKSAQCKETRSTNEKYTFRTWFLRLGLIGDEFKNCRSHLLSHLDGNIAWKDPNDAIAQRERIKQQRIEEHQHSLPPEQACSDVSDCCNEVETVQAENNEATECSYAASFEDDECMDLSM